MESEHWSLDLQALAPRRSKMALKKQEVDWQGKTLILESGKLATLASGAVTATMGETVVLATAVVAPEPKEGADFFPLTVDYEERLYAAGKIKGSRFVKREGRPSDEAVLTARLVDRPIRPLFPKDFRSEVQIIITVFSYDGENDPDVLAVVAASAALEQTVAPFKGPVAAARIGEIDGKLMVNPSRKEMETATLDLVAAGTAEKINMIEAKGKEIPEEKMLEAIGLAKIALKPALEIQKTFINENRMAAAAEEPEVLKEVKKILGKRVHEAVRIAEKSKREEEWEKLRGEVMTGLEGDHKQTDLSLAFDKVLEEEVRHAILDEGVRPDGRKEDEIRPISIEVGLLPRTHGSALFTRGQTQALTIATLGAPGEEQIIETMEEEGTKRFMHHYNFPPFSVGEVKSLRTTSRREIGHGALAEKALEQVIPDREKFPYTIRLVSEILSSNGSSSMASVCGCSLALMDAGVPITAPVAGIAIGMVSREKEYKLLTDIQGVEDFGGDMDFKIAGTQKGITAIQLDTKIDGIAQEIIKETLERAKKARLGILEKMKKVISSPRKELSHYAPRIFTLKINPEKIGELIGPGGKTINKIVAAAGGKELVSIDIEEDGTVSVSSPDVKAAEKAIAMVEGMTKEVEIGQIYPGIVSTIKTDRFGKEIGAIVQIFPNQDGMVHISEVAPERINKVSDVLKIGQAVSVKVLEIDKERGRIGLSIRQANSQPLDKV